MKMQRRLSPLRSGVERRRRRLHRRARQRRRLRL